jgi:prevent-host-death family protein
VSIVGIRELKNRLTQHLRETKKGQEIIVTERGNPIAIIQPIRSARGLRTLEARLAALAARGIVTLPGPRTKRPASPARIKGAPLSRTVLEDRR